VLLRTVSATAAAVAVPWRRVGGCVFVARGSAAAVSGAVAHRDVVRGASRPDAAAVSASRPVAEASSAGWLGAAAVAATCAAASWGRSAGGRPRRGLGPRAAAETATEATTAAPRSRPSKEIGVAVPADLDWSKVSPEWEIDCFSRPVLQDGKKLWELLVTDRNAVYRRVAQMKPTRVNSVVVQKVISVFIQESQVKPTVIRFYRKVMKNMLTVALNAVKDENGFENLKLLPSRNCHMLRKWLAYREKAVYPKMEGYAPPPPKRIAPVQASLVQMALENIPEKIKFGRYAFSAIPFGSIAAVKPGKVPGRMCPLPATISADTMVNGIVILTARADVIVSQLKTMELCGVRVNLETSELLMDFGIDQTYLADKIPVEEKETCLQFERSKRKLGGLHFIAVHNPLTDGEMSLPIDDEAEGSVSGFWVCMDYSAEES